MRQRNRLVWLLVGCLGLLLVAGAVASAQQPVFVRLGLLAAAESPAGRGAQLAIAEINGAGGITGLDGRVYAFELLSVPVVTADEVRAGLDALEGRDVLALLGPDDTAVALATFRDLRAFARPLLTAAVGDTLTIADTDDLLFRSRAPEQVWMQAAAAYLTSLAPRPSVVIVHDGSTGPTADSVRSFTGALSTRGIMPRSNLQLSDAASLRNALSSLEDLNPDVIAVWGSPEHAATLLIRLRAIGWSGVYFYRDATTPAFRDAVVAGAGQQQGVIAGVTSWAPGVNTTVSNRFLQHYVTTFDAVPDAFSAAAYDAVYLIAGAIQQGGGTPTGVRRGLQTMEALDGVQGVLNPAQFSVGETLNTVAAFQLNTHGVPQVERLFINGSLVANPQTEGGVSFLATAVPTLPPATPTPFMTATPEGVWGAVNSSRLNVRSGPGMNFDVLGQLSAGDIVFPIGANADFSWLVVPFRGGYGWVAAYLVDLQGNRNQLPFIQPPPTPTIVITSTPSPTPYADLVVLSASVEPLRPISGQQFVVRALVGNQGIVASLETALASSFQPGEVYTSSQLPPLAPSQTVEVILRPTVSGAGTYTVQLVLDLNNLVNEGPAGEANNLYPVTYTLDHAVIRSGTAMLAPGQQHDMVGSGTINLSWDGATLSALNGAQVAVLPGLDWNHMHWGQLSGIVGGGIPRASLPNGIVVGIITAPEGYRGALRVDGYNGDSIQYSFRVYAP
jgi:branched-chain amino acid transport system substrate-binding protein